ACSSCVMRHASSPASSTRCIANTESSSLLSARRRPSSPKSSPGTVFRRYQWASLIVESELPLPELPEARGAEGAHVRFHLATSRRPDESSGLRDDSAPAPPWLSIERDGDGHVMRFRDLAEFHLSADRGTIRCTAAPQLGLETVRHLLLDQVL